MWESFDGSRPPIVIAKHYTACADGRTATSCALICPRFISPCRVSLLCQLLLLPTQATSACILPLDGSDTNIGTAHVRTPIEDSVVELLPA